MPRGAAPRALLGVLALIIAIAVAVVPVVEARPKDKHGGKQDKVAAETLPANDASQPEALAPPVEQSLTTTGGGSSNERTLLSLDADGDYLPDALDNCPNVQNPDQADADGDGHGDACPVYQDTDGDSVPDKQDNCPTLATSDFADNDGDGVGNPCDKSPDGIEPEPEPLPELNSEGGEAAAEAPPPENGENLNGTAVERPGRDRSRERSRTEISRPVITTGADTEDVPPEETAEGTGGDRAEEVVYEEPVRDNPRRNEELIAESAASGELYAPPEPPPVAQRAWDETVEPATWDAVVRIDAGATENAEPGNQGASSEPDSSADDGRRSRTEEVRDSEFARGWVRAKLLLQEELAETDGVAEGEEQTTEPGTEPLAEIEGDVADPAQGASETGAGQTSGGRAPVPVENGLVIMGTGHDEERTRDNQRDAGRDSVQADAGDDAGPANDAELLDEAAPLDDGNRDERGSQKDESRRNGSSRGAAAAQERQRAAVAVPEEDPEPQDTGRRNRSNGNDSGPNDWSDDRYFEGGSALNWSGDIGVAGTDDDSLYLTQRSGSGPGKRRGFDYTIPVEDSGPYMVRLFFAEPYWGAPGGPEGDEGRRVFSVAAEGEIVFEDLDVYAEAGSLTALVKQVEVNVEDGELNLRFTATEGEPIVAAIEVLAPAA